MNKRKSILFMLLLMLVCVFCFVGCSAEKQKVALANVENINYDGNNITWNAVDGADSYAITIDGEAIPVDGTFYAYEGKKNFSVSVQAIASADNTTYVSSESATLADFIAIGPTVVSLNNGMFEWTAVENAYGYAVDQNGVANQGYTEELTIAPVKPQDSNVATIRVRPLTKAEKHFGVWSNAKEVVLLDNPTNIRCVETVAEGIEGSAKTIVWDEVKDAYEYKIEINDGIFYTKVPQFVFGNENAITWDTFVNMSISKSFMVKITALAEEGKDVVSSGVVEKSFLYLDQCSNLNISKGILTWDSIPGATEYLVKINEATVITASTNEYEGFEPEKTYRVAVKASSSDQSVFSIWSADINFTLLKAPILDWTNNGENNEGITQGTIRWNAIDNCNGYRIEIYRGKARQEKLDPISVQTPSDTSYNPLPIITLPGDYYVYAVAVGAGAYTTSCYSECLKIAVIEPITAVSFASTTPDEYAVAGEVIAIFNAPTYSNNVRVKIDSIDYSSNVEKSEANGIVFSFKFGYDIKEAIGSEENATLRRVQLQATKDGAGVLDKESNTVYINSPQSSEFCINQLATPTNLTYLSGVVSWNMVDEANGYYYVIIDEEGKQIVSNFTYGTSVAVPDNIESGPYQFKVAARGNGNMMVSGSYSNELKLYKLPEPKNVSFDGSTLTWEDSSEISETSNIAISNYKVVIGTKIINVLNNSYEVLPEDISIVGTPVYVQAIGATIDKEANKPHTVNSYQSNKKEPTLIIYKLLTPYAPVVTNTKIMWNRVDNAKDYDLYYGNEHIGNYSTESVDVDDALLQRFSNLSGGDAKDFTLVANPGTDSENSVAYIRSDSSLTTTITVLPKPEISFDENTGTFSWEGKGTDTNYCVKIHYKDSDKKDAIDTVILQRSENNQYSPVLTGDVGDSYNIEIFALGDNGIESIRSESEYYEAVLKQHTTPSGGMDISVDGNKITVKLKDVPSNNNVAAAYFGINIGGTETRVSRAQAFEGYTFNTSTSGKYDIKVRALGGDRKNNGLDCYLASDYSAVNTIYLLAALKEGEVVIRTEGSGSILKRNLIITDVYKAEGYSYTIEYCKVSEDDPNQKVVLNTVTGNVQNIDNDMTRILVDRSECSEARFIVLKIKTIGNGSDTFDSASNGEMTFDIA